jgi:hypothetical protein
VSNLIIAIEIVMATLALMIVVIAELSVRRITRRFNAWKRAKPPE